MAVERPIIVLGCPRSGTRLVARVLGQPAGHCLITEHTDKQSIPEDRSGVQDTQLWFDRFRFYAARSPRSRPAVELPRWQLSAAAALAADYRRIAAGRRLVVKNPQNLLRVGQLRAIWPEAQFVFVLRDPREVLASACEGNRRRSSKSLWRRLTRRLAAGRRGQQKLSRVHLLKSPALRLLPDDLFLQTAWSWTEACEIHRREQGTDWHLLRYEDLTARPAETVSSLFAALGIDDPVGEARAAALPRAPNAERQRTALLAAIAGSGCREEALQRLREGLRFCPYPAAERWFARVASDPPADRHGASSEPSSASAEWLPPGAGTAAGAAGTGSRSSRPASHHWHPSPSDSGTGHRQRSTLS